MYATANLKYMKSILRIRKSSGQVVSKIVTAFKAWCTGQGHGGRLPTEEKLCKRVETKSAGEEQYYHLYFLWGQLVFTFAISPASQLGLRFSWNLFC